MKYQNLFKYVVVTIYEHTHSWEYMWLHIHACTVCVRSWLCKCVHLCMYMCVYFCFCFYLFFFFSFSREWIYLFFCLSSCVRMFNTCVYLYCLYLWDWDGTYNFVCAHAYLFLWGVLRTSERVVRVCNMALMAIRKLKAVWYGSWENREFLCNW